MTCPGPDAEIAATLDDALVAESLTDLWALLHRNAAIAVHESEIHCLTSIALETDEDLVAYLLLRKLRIARKVGLDDPDSGAARMNSLVTFTHGGGDPLCRQLVHPHAVETTPDAVGMDSLIGAGLIGLTPAQSVLWPDASFSLTELNILDVRNERRGSARNPGPPRSWAGRRRTLLAGRDAHVER
jgi:regulator of nucleoside diphosphate kinase